MGRLSKSHTGNEAEVTLTVIDTLQQRGLGTALLRRLVAIGRDAQLDRISAELLAKNTGMQKAYANAGFRRAPIAEGLVRAAWELRPAS